jgi:hypothetical protein
MTREDILQAIRDEFGAASAEIIECAADEAWGALKGAHQRGAVVHAVADDCLARAAVMYREGQRDVDAMAEEIVRAEGLTPIRGVHGLEAVR